MNSPTVDCPICMDAIEMTKNFTTTECGHCFHTGCLMQSVAHNGFGCPYCRTKMAEEPEADEESEWSEVTDEEEEEPFDDHALNGMRWLMMRSEGEEIPEDDVEEMDEELEEREEEPEVPAIPKPSVSHIAEKLTQRGITFEDMVKVLLLHHEEYNNESQDHESIDDKIFGEMRIIISNYARQEQVTN